MYSIAVPLLDKQGEVVAAINVSMEFYSKEQSKFEEYDQELIEKGRMISSRSGILWTLSILSSVTVLFHAETS